jgi:hypothetical protein
MFSCVSDVEELRKTGTLIDRAPAISPDYSGVTIPPNIGPLNFLIKDSAAAYCIIVRSKNGRSINLLSRSRAVRFPIKQWKALLARNRGESLYIDVLRQGADKKWYRYKPIENFIAPEATDPYLAYRTISVLYNYSRDICLYQRNLETNRESEVLNALNFFPGCCNCHTFLNNDPKTFFIHVRTQDLGNCALLSQEGKLSKINAKFQYTSWHPGGKLIAYSINKVDQCFHMTWKDLREVYDHTSGILIYDIEKKKIVTVPKLFVWNVLETWPAWSPDGRYLYFCSAPIPWTDVNVNPPPDVDKVKYSLLRIPFDRQKDAWGEIDTVLSSERTGLSISQPRFSPDGRHIVFCMHNSGPSSYAEKSSDLYLMDVKTGNYAKLSCNSDESESWHSFSSNGRWLAFSSKRNNGLLTRVYLCHIDSSGNSSKAFVLPQDDPAFYDSFIKVYNVPEFATASFPVSQKRLVDAIRGRDKIDVTAPVTRATPSKKQETDPWPQMQPH